MSDFQVDSVADAWGAAIREEAEQSPEIEEKKTRRGRPKGSPSKGGSASSEPSSEAVVESGHPPVSPEDIQEPIHVVSDLITKSMGVQDLEDHEVESVAVAFAPVVEKYLGHMVANYAPEIIAAGVLIKVSRPRVKEYIENRKAEPDAEGTSGVEIRSDFGGPVADS